jgi:hypothetical protein
LKDQFGKAKDKTIGIFNGLEKVKEINVDEKSKYPEHELFIYCVLLGRHEMAEIFWSSGKVINKSKEKITFFFYKNKTQHFLFL